MKNRIRKWWENLDYFSQFWLFWFGVTLIGVTIILIISSLIGGGK